MKRYTLSKTLFLAMVLVSVSFPFLSAKAAPSSKKKSEYQESFRFKKTEYTAQTAFQKSTQENTETSKKNSSAQIP